MKTPTTLSDAFGQVGGPRVVAAELGLSVRAVYKWISKNSLPRTEYSSETSYAKKIASMPMATFTQEALLDIGRPSISDNDAA